MKVVHLFNELRASGGEVMTAEAVPLFQERGFELVIVSTGAQVGAFAEAFAERGARVVHLPFERHPYYAVRLWKFLKQERPSIVHLQAERANAVLGITARLAGARVVRTVRSVFRYQGRLRTVRRVERAALRALGVQHIAIGPSVEQNELSWLSNPTLRVDNAVAPRFRPPDDEERHHARKEYGVTEGCLVITSIGNCSSVKNHNAIIDTLGEIATNTGRQVTYLHAGSGEDEELERVSAATHRDTGVDVRFLGTVSDVRSLLWASDLYCMPSLHEGLPIAALEALACGVPSVLADVDGLRDVHPPAPSLRFVPPTAEGVIAGVLELHQSGDHRGAAASVAERVRKERHVLRQVEALISIYQATAAVRSMPVESANE